MKNIVLIGFMGSGKTTVGKVLSQKLGLPLLDTDHYLEQMTGHRISWIFEKYGEAHFRNLETEALRKLVSEETGRVISCGGGLPLREENRLLLKQLGTVVYLKVSPETVEERLRGDTTRPLLQGLDVSGRIRRLLEERSPLYEAAADMCVSVDRYTPAEVCNNIINSQKNT